jgi:hypothetical protein
MCQAKEAKAGAILVTPAMIREGVDELSSWDDERETRESVLRRVLVAIFGAEALRIASGVQGLSEGP